MKQSIRTCALHSTNTNQPASVRPILSRFQSFASCGASSQETSTITNSEWLGPRCHHSLPAVSNNGENTASRSGNVPNNAPHASARLPMRLPSINSPIAAPSVACVIESTPRTMPDFRGSETGKSKTETRAFQLTRREHSLR